MEVVVYGMMLMSPLPLRVLFKSGVMAVLVRGGLKFRRIARGFVGNFIPY